MSRRDREQLFLALRAAKTARHHLYELSLSEKLPGSTAALVRTELAYEQAQVVRLNKILAASND
jgi:hypothetical protein